MKRLPERNPAVKKKCLEQETNVSNSPWRGEHTASRGARGVGLEEEGFSEEGI